MCGLQDSATHILNACRDSTMKALCIERRNSAARLILQEVQQGGKGNCKIYVDSGSQEKMHGLGCFELRLTDLFTEKDMIKAGLAVDNRGKMRPNLLLIHANMRKRKRSGGPPKLQNEAHMHVIEIAYTNELRYDEKLEEKQAQHDRLQMVLKNSDYKYMPTL